MQNMLAIMIHHLLPLQSVGGVSLQVVVARTLPYDSAYCHIPAQAPHTSNHARMAFRFAHFPVAMALSWKACMTLQGQWRSSQRLCLQVVEGDDDLMALPGLHESDEYLETASRRSCSSSALLEAAVSSAVNHPNVVQTYDYRVFDPDAQVLSSAASFRSPLRVRLQQSDRLANLRTGANVSCSSAAEIIQATGMSST